MIYDNIHFVREVHKYLCTYVYIVTKYNFPSEIKKLYYYVCAKIIEYILNIYDNIHFEREEYM